jgi:hypothetical protein
MGNILLTPKVLKYCPFFNFFLVHCKLPFFGQNCSHKKPRYPSPFEILAEALITVIALLIHIIQLLCEIFSYFCTKDLLIKNSVQRDLKLVVWLPKRQLDMHTVVYCLYMYLKQADELTALNCFVAQQELLVGKYVWRFWLHRDNHVTHCSSEMR